MVNPSDTSPSPASRLEKASDTPNPSEPRIRQAADDVATRAKSVAQKAIARGAQRVGKSAHTASNALRRAAAECETEETWLSYALSKSADGIDTITQRLAAGDMTQMAGEINAFARRQPALFIGAALALGFVAARIGKAALENPHDDARTPSGTML